MIENIQNKINENELLRKTIKEYEEKQKNQEQASDMSDNKFDIMLENLLKQKQEQKHKRFRDVVFIYTKTFEICYTLIEGDVL